MYRHGPGLLETFYSSIVGRLRKATGEANGTAVVHRVVHPSPRHEGGPGRRTNIRPDGTVWPARPSQVRDGDGPVLRRCAVVAGNLLFGCGSFLFFVCVAVICCKLTSWVPGVIDTLLISSRYRICIWMPRVRKSN